jgi:hypothetical protein
LIHHRAFPSDVAGAAGDINGNDASHMVRAHPREATQAAVVNPRNA